MKSAYELAMERLEKSAPSAKVTDEQRAVLAEIDSTYKARIAEREVFLQSELQKALAACDSNFRARFGACRRSARTRRPKRAGNDRRCSHAPRCARSLLG